MHNITCCKASCDAFLVLVIVPSPEGVCRCRTTQVRRFGDHALDDDGLTSRNGRCSR